MHWYVRTYSKEYLYNEVLRSTEGLNFVLGKSCDLSPSPAQMWTSASLLLLSSVPEAVSTVKVPLSAPVPPDTC